MAGGRPLNGCTPFAELWAQPNEIEQAFGPLQAGTCGGPDGFDCIRELGRLWAANFDAILTEIEALRDGRPTALRLVNAANPFVSVPR